MVSLLLPEYLVYIDCERRTVRIPDGQPIPVSFPRASKVERLNPSN
jgi:hypothetical protein